MKCLLTLLAALMLAPLAALHTAEKLPDDRNWLQKNGTLIFHDAFEREEEGNLAKAIGNGWNSATADRVPNIKQAHLDKGILKIASATKEAGHNAHIHHAAGFTDGGVIVRFRFPALSKGEALKLGFVDRETKGIHAGHLCYALLSQNSIARSDLSSILNRLLRASVVMTECSLLISLGAEGCPTEGS